MLDQKLIVKLLCFLLFGVPDGSVEKNLENFSEIEMSLVFLFFLFVKLNYFLAF